MDRFKIKSKNKKIFAQLCENAEFSDEDRAKIHNCDLAEVILTPQANTWSLSLSATENIDELLHSAEVFLTEKYGVNVEINCTVSLPAPVEHTSKPAAKKSPVPSSGGGKTIAKKISGGVTKIEYVKDGDSKILVSGEIVGEIALRELKKDKGFMLTFSLVDDTDGIACKKFFNKDEKSAAETVTAQLKKTERAKIQGSVKFDDYSNENVLFVDKIELLDETPARIDIAPVKRVELHVHTKMSAMDAVISPAELIETAANWGWAAVAITDHGVVQAFPEAAETARKLAKSGRHIKILYGMEGYLITEPEQRFANHVIILAKNKTGLDNLYRLVSISQLKFFRYTARIPKNLLAELREGLIIGSACEAGELIRAIVAEKSEAEIEAIAQFYDYLEIQPYHNNDFLVRSKDFPNITSDEDLIAINKRVAELAKKLGKPLVATCDAHFLNAEDSIYRAILMHGKGFDDAEFQPPLYLRTTEEMLKEFTYLDEKLAFEAVVTNPRMIANSIEELQPIPDGLYSPAIPGADDEIMNMAYSKARRMYGENLPPIVEARLKQELTPIIAHGFSVLYLIAQRLVKKSNDDGYLVGSRGSVGSSFVAAMTGISEVNPLVPHWRCPKCQYSKFITDGSYSCGYDLPDMDCPVCGYPLEKDGHDIPFAVFLGFDGDKVPDIDLNFSGEYQPTAHKYTEILFGKHNVYRAGTIMTVAEKTAMGYVRKFLDEKNLKKNKAYIARLAKGCEGVKTTTGQHAGGIMVVPRDMDVHYFTPIQHPADKKSSNIITTHFDYHSISSRLVKLDILGHDDPTVIKMLEDIIHVLPQDIPLDDAPTLSLFSGTSAINVDPDQLGTKSGTFGIPEFRTSFTRGMIDETHPDCFSDLVRISGFSHGTDVWLGNAQDLIKNKICTLKEAISGREDMLRYFINKSVDSLKSFKIMERVRKGKGIPAEDVEILKAHGVPDWYIDSCQKIKYLFPRAHATAYVMMAYRIAYCKVHYPLAYYAAYFSIRADEFDADEIIKGKSHVKARIKELEKIVQSKSSDTKKDEDTLAVFQLAYEMFLRGFKIERVDLYESDAEKFIVLKDSLRPPLNSLVGVGTVAANSIVEARKAGKFQSIDDLKNRAGISKTTIAALQEHGCLKNLQATNQISLFDFLEG